MNKSHMMQKEHARRTSIAGDKGSHDEQRERAYHDAVEQQQRFGSPGSSPPAMPQSMLDRDYNKNADGSYTVKDRTQK